MRNRFIGEGEMSESLNLKGYIVTVDIEKAFDSLSHSFLLVYLKKYRYGNDFIKWVEMLLERQESCFINGGNTTKYFKLQKGARQGDPISTYLFILCLEIVLILIRANKRVKGHTSLSTLTCIQLTQTILMKCIDLGNDTINNYWNPLFVQQRVK